MFSDDYVSLDELGWSPHFAESFEEWRLHGLTPARVVTDHGAIKAVHTGVLELRAELAGRLTHLSPDADPVLPAVGDWVAIHTRPGLARIDAVLERKSVIRRRASSYQSRESRQQVLAANVDVALVIAAADSSRVDRRIERYLTAAAGSGSRPVVVLTKADLRADMESLRDEMQHIAGTAPVLTVSALLGTGIDDVAAAVGKGETAVLLGPSGVGKSTLLNRLLGEDVAETRQVRSDGKGRHTTTHRQLFLMPGGSMVIDTPGLRELQLWSPEEDEAEEALFADIEELATLCRFADCGHDREPGCAIQAAIADGRLSPDRMRSYQKLLREAELVTRHVNKRHQKAAAVRHRRVIAALREEDPA